MNRWRLAVPALTYEMEISPNAQASPIPIRDIVWDYSREGHSGTRAGRTPHPWSFSGVLRSEAQYDALLDMLNRRRKTTITTDLEQIFYVRLVAFKPSQTRERKGSPYRHEYTMDALILPGSPGSVVPGGTHEALYERFTL